VLEVPGVHLWNGIKDPYLYRLSARLKRGETVLDEISIPYGIRTFSIDPDKGFFLNGVSYPLRGVSRHQDYKGCGNAISYEQMEKDMELIREIGANTIRLAHYQHSQYFYDLCDKYGMVVWAEIPYISEHMPEGRENTFFQMKELIVQNFNHPSIVTWGLSNEITISLKHKEDMLDNHHKLQAFVKEMDPTRPTTLACYAMCHPFHPVSKISDVVAWNLYLGWYVPGLFLNDLFMKFYHWKYPMRPLGYSEYGAEGMPNLHSARPRRGDHSEEYQAKYHEYMLKCIERHPFLWSTYVWNMFDFAADARNQGGEPGMNHKGLVTFDRKIRKDSFYLYKAWWSDEVFIHLCGKRYKYRAERTTHVTVYTNREEVSLYNNGKLVGTKKGRYAFHFKIRLEEENHLEARAGNLKDSAVIYKTDRPRDEYKVKKGKSQNWV
ncbi:MAG: glycoside hydrolase family 2 protein, partial [Lachnospiraceae bacterium]|nr:glycoside hydrolase family 2 protein [Lachnospiraceae bacterium]